MGERWEWQNFLHEVLVCHHVRCSRALQWRPRMAPVGQESVVNETTVCPNNSMTKFKAWNFALFFLVNHSFRVWKEFWNRQVQAWYPALVPHTVPNATCPHIVHMIITRGATLVAYAYTPGAGPHISGTSFNPEIPDASVKLPKVHKRLWQSWGAVWAFERFQWSPRWIWWSKKFMT